MTFKMYFCSILGCFEPLCSPYAALKTPTPDLHLSISANHFTHNVLQVNQMKE